MILTGLNRTIHYIRLKGVSPRAKKVRQQERMLSLMERFDNGEAFPERKAD